ncbi:hypothetical protein H3R26_03570 [Lactobacillus sp. W8092]|nr:hypothetical protein [Lactobacillus sp. W8092]
MKQNIKRASVITLLAISLGAATTPSIASAATLNNQQDVTATNQQQFNKELEQKNNNVNIKNYSEVQYDAKNNQTTVTISDIELRQYLIAQGANPNQLGNLGLMRSYGVSKIVWYGRISNGNANLYLSKGALQAAKSVGFIGTFYYGLFRAYAGNYFGAVKSFLSSVNWAIKITNTQNGRVYMMRGFWYAGSYAQ